MWYRCFEIGDDAIDLNNDGGRAALHANTMERIHGFLGVFDQQSAFHRILNGAHIKVQHYFTDRRRTEIQVSSCFGLIASLDTNLQY